MGFIERLRQQKAAETLRMSQQEAELSRKREEEAAARQQKETQERELHQQRRKQAEAYFQESGVETLITELAEITGKYSHGYRTCGRFDDAWFSHPQFGYRKLPSLATDPDSVSFGIVWDERKIGSKSVHLQKSTAHGSMEKWDVFEAKFIAVETLPDGNVIFHARRDVSVSEPKWKSSKDILDSVLAQSYNSPRIQRYNGNFMTYFPDGGD